MPPPPTGTGNGLDWTAGLATLGTGLAGLGAPTGMQGSGTSSTNSTQEQEGNQNQFSNQAFTTWLSNLVNSFQDTSGQSTTNYNLDPSTRAFLDKLIGQYSAIASPFDAQKYQAGQIQNINANSDLQRQAVQNIMAARGVSGPAAATSEANIEGQRIGNITQMQGQVPFLKNQYDTANLGNAANFFSMIPKGTTTSTQGSTSAGSSSNTQGNNTSTSNSGGTYYNGTRGSSNTTQQQQQNQTGGSGWLKALGMGAGVAASLFSDKTLKTDIEKTDPDKSLEAILALKPSTWKWTKDDSRDMGVIAQELREVLPELVHKDPEGSGKLKVNYAGLISQLVGAVQSLNKRTEVLA